MRRFTVFVLIAVLLFTSAGCTHEWRKKFIRKKKTVSKPRIYQAKKYEKKPTQALYNKHYNYCITWLSELADDLGDNHKKDVRCINEALTHIKDMQYFLIEDKAATMDKHIRRLEEVREILVRGRLDHAYKDYVRSTVDREERYIRSDLYYDKIKDYMKKSFDEEEYPDAVEAGDGI